MNASELALELAVALSDFIVAHGDSLSPEQRDKLDDAFWVLYRLDRKPAR